MKPASRLERLIVEVPLPPPELSPNARPHPKAKAKQVSIYRATVGLLALQAMGRDAKPRWTAAVIRCRFRVPRRRDPDNLVAALKAAQDGLVDAGVLADDDQTSRVWDGTEVCPQGPHGVTLTIEPVGV